MTTITFDGKEVGFGSPTVVDSNGDEQSFYDGGFGAAYPLTVDGVDFINNAEAYFGDPLIEISVSLLGEEKGLFIPDNGGTILTFQGNFGLIFEEFFNTTVVDETPIGPLEIIFTNTITGDEYYALNTLPGFQTNVYSNIYHNQIIVATPSMLKGDYSIKIKYNRVLEVTLPQTLSVIHRMRNDKTNSIRNNYPKWYNVGQRSDNFNSPAQYYPQSESNLAVMTSAFGEVWNYAYDNDYTVTTADYKIDSGFLNVESTITFDNSGEIHLDDQQVLTYTGKTATSLTGVSGSVKLIKKGTRVFNNKSLGKFEKYYRAQNLGFYYPRKTIREEDFWDAVRIVEHNERPSATVIFNYLYHFFKSINLTKEVTITGRSISQPTDLSDFNCSHVGRICRINNKFYYIEGDTISVDGGLLLDEVGCPYWEGSKDKNGDNVFNGETYSIEILPWIIYDDEGGFFTLSLERTAFVYPNGYIDLDYIDLNIFLEGADFSAEARNVNIDLFVAAGIQDRIYFKQRCEDSFGTYYTPQAIPDALRIIPDYEYN